MKSDITVKIIGKECLQPTPGGCGTRGDAAPVLMSKMMDNAGMANILFV